MGAFYLQRPHLFDILSLHPILHPCSVFYINSSNPIPFQETAEPFRVHARSLLAINASNGVVVSVTSQKTKAPD